MLTQLAEATCQFQSPSTVTEMHLNQSPMKSHHCLIKYTVLKVGHVTALVHNHVQRAKNHPASTQTKHHSQAYEWAHRFPTLHFKLKHAQHLCPCLTSWFSRFPWKAFSRSLNSEWLWISSTEILLTGLVETSKSSQPTTTPQKEKNTVQPCWKEVPVQVTCLSRQGQVCLTKLAYNLLTGYKQWKRQILLTTTIISCQIHNGFENTAIIWFRFYK